MYSMLLTCCEKYYDNLSWKFPAECPDGQGCCGLDLQQFNTHMKFDIPSLYRNSAGRIDNPGSDYYGNANEYDQYALLDLIEYVGQNCKDISIGLFHSYFGHNHIRLLDSTQITTTFRDEINGIFQKTGLLYTMTEKAQIERVVNDSVLSPEIEHSVETIVDKGTRELVKESITLFKQPRPNEHHKAVEKLWDALESLKTHFPGIEDSQYDKKLSKKLSTGQDDVARVFEKELKELGNIGNNYSIRHFNDKQIAVTDERHFDYFFNRCLAFVATAIQYLE
jgi:hypothetical protein